MARPIRNRRSVDEPAPRSPTIPNCSIAMQDGLEAARLATLVYSDGAIRASGGVQADKDAGVELVGGRRAVVFPPQGSIVLLRPVAHPALLGILGILAKGRRWSFFQNRSTYPGGALDCGRNWGLRLVGLAHGQ